MRLNFRKAGHTLLSLQKNQSGTVAVIMAFLFPILIAAFGLGFEITNWYLSTRAMQNAADASAVAAATNGSSNYNIEAAAVATQYGYTNGTNNVTVTASNAATCPSGITSPCYSVTISSVVPLILTEVIGYLGNSTLNGARAQSLTSAAIANKPVIQTPICLLGLDTSGTAIRTNGAPNTDFTGCTVMSNSTATCNGSNLKATLGLAHGNNNGCGITQYSGVPVVSDPYAYMASNIPTNLPTKCSNSYSQESRHGSTWSGGTTWSGSTNLSGTASLAGNTLICGDLRLTGNVTINAAQPDGAVLYIENGLLDLQGFTLSTASGSGVTIVFTGTNTGSYQHYPTDNGGAGTLDIEAPKSATAPFPGMAIYQDPSLTRNVDFTYAGNAPTWDLTGGVYLPNANVTMSGAINKSTNGAVCMVMVTKDITVNGTGSIYAQTPDGSGCQAAGLNMPTATIPGRTKLVF